MNRLSFNVNHLASEKGVGPLVASNYMVLQNTVAAKSSGAARATGTGSVSSSGTGSVVAPATPLSFTGDASMTRIGLMGGIATFVAVGAALLFLV